MISHTLVGSNLHHASSRPSPFPLKNNANRKATSPYENGSYISITFRSSQLGFNSFDSNFECLRNPLFRRAFQCKASDSYSADNSGNPNAKQKIWPLPESIDESVEQARAACQRAMSNGEKRLELELLLPLIGATDLDDWPGGIQQQFKAALPLVNSLLDGLVRNNKDVLDNNEKGKDAKFSVSIIDEGDAVGLWQNKNIALVLFPTTDVFEEIKKLQSGENQNRTLITVNPQWNPGQVISDFGFGPWRKQKEEFFSSFNCVYSLKRLRLRSEDVRIFKCYPGLWQVFVADEYGNATLVSKEQVYPSYKKLEEIIKTRNSKNGNTLFDRLKKEFNFNKNSL